MTNSTDNRIIFYFAWADATETTFGPEHQLPVDAEGSLPIFSFQIEHKEGSAAVLNVLVLNPKVALLAQDKLYCWFACSVDGGDTAIPIFFGRLIGIPTDLLAETITLRFDSQPLDFEEQKQRLAEFLKLRPFWDPLFLAPDKRDDANSILEGYSGRWHVGRTDQTVTFSDILLAGDGSDDGDEVFTEEEVPYDSVKLQIGEIPPQRVVVSAEATWTQKAIGVVGMGSKSFQTYTGQGLLGEWPKALTNLGGGWVVKSGAAVDNARVDSVLTVPSSFRFENHKKKHNVGDTMSIDESSSSPIFHGDSISKELTRRFQVGYISPDPDEKDIQPAWVKTTTVYVGQYDIQTTLTLGYNSKRPRVEQISLSLGADLQPLLAPAVFPTEEVITLASVDLGSPLVDIKNWLAIKDRDVVQSQVMYTHYPEGTLQNSFQIAKNPGRVGNGTEPDFDVVPGGETVDNEVTWISLGTTFNLSATMNWQLGTFIRVGQLLNPEIEDWVTWNDLVQPGFILPPRITGVAVHDGTYVMATNGGSFHICTLSGNTGLGEPGWATTYGAVTVDGDVEWTCLGTKRPDGTVYFICVTAGKTNQLYLPNFNYTLGSLTTDGTVVWKCLGLASDFAPIPIVDRARRSYFPTDRGLWSLEYLICLARARLRQKSRAITVSWECSFERAITLSCRKTATITDDRLPGGTATGKIIAYTINGDANTGVFNGTITIGCAIGRGGTVEDAAGTADYVEDGTIEDAPTLGDGVVVVAGDCGYSVPIDAPADDGLVFPLTREQIVVKELTHFGQQMANIAIGLQTAKEIAQLELASQPPEPAQLGDSESSGGYITTTGISASASLRIQEKIQVLSQQSIDAQLSKPSSAIWYDLWLKPVDGGPFIESFVIDTTQLKVVKQIDTEGSGSL